jgi:hypothetical protein
MRLPKTHKLSKRQGRKKQDTPGGKAWARLQQEAIARGLAVQAPASPTSTPVKKRVQRKRKTAARKKSPLRRKPRSSGA